MHTFAIVFMILVKRKILGHLKKERRNQAVWLCVSASFSFSAVSTGLRGLRLSGACVNRQSQTTSNLFVREQDANSVNCTSRTESPLGWSKCLMKGTRRRGPGAWQVCAVYPMGTRLNIPVHNLGAICLWAHIRITQKQESFIHTQSTQISMSQKLSSFIPKVTKPRSVTISVQKYRSCQWDRPIKGLQAVI